MHTLYGVTKKVQFLIVSRCIAMILQNETAKSGAEMVQKWFPKIHWHPTGGKIRR